MEGKQNPIEYKNGILEYNNNVDISSYSTEQQLVLNRYKEMIENTDVIYNVDVVDRDMKIFNNGKFSLQDIGANGSTQMISANAPPTPIKLGDIHVANKLEYKSMEVDVFIARNPSQNINGQITDIQDAKRYAGFTSIHELAGHGYELLRLMKAPEIQHIGTRAIEFWEKDEANIRVENFDNLIRKVYRKHMKDNSLDGKSQKHPRYYYGK